MAKASKQTKKFQNKHLKHTIEQRKKVQAQNKKIASRKSGSSSSGESNAPKRADGKAKEVFEDMSVDDFFGGGLKFLKKRIRTRTSKIQLKKTKKKTRLLKRKMREAMKENLKN